MTEQRQGQTTGGPGGLGQPGTPGAGRMGGMPGKTTPPHQPDALAGTPRADVWPESDASDLAPSAAPIWHPDPPSPQEKLRLKTRQELREFLRAVPRTEPEAALAILRPDGTTRVLTRAELSTAIDRMRPRMRQVVRLSLEERWTRQRVCEYLRHISIKTFERDQIEGLDLLAHL